MRRRRVRDCRGVIGSDSTVFRPGRLLNIGLTQHLAHEGLARIQPLVSRGRIRRSAAQCCAPEIRDRTLNRRFFRAIVLGLNLCSWATRHLRAGGSFPDILHGAVNAQQHTHLCNHLSRRGHRPGLRDLHDVGASVAFLMVVVDRGRGRPGVGGPVDPPLRNRGLGIRPSHLLEGRERRLGRDGSLFAGAVPDPSVPQPAEHICLLRPDRGPAVPGESLPVDIHLYNHKLWRSYSWAGPCWIRTTEARLSRCPTPSLAPWRRPSPCRTPAWRRWNSGNWH